MADNMKDRGEGQEEYSFVKERIIEPPKKRNGFFKRLFSAVLGGLLFGAVAAVSFVFVYPYAQKYLNGQEETSDNMRVTIPKDDDNTDSSAAVNESETTTENSVPESTEPATEPENPATTEEAVMALIQKALEDRNLEASDYKALYSSMYGVVTKANKAIVTVASVKNDTDIFNNTYEAVEYTSGIIYSITGDDIFILTNWAGVETAELIRVTFFSGFSCEAEVQMYDVSSGMAVICVRTDFMEENALAKLESVKLGNSNLVKAGDPVIAVGNPMGYMYTMSYGVVTTVKNTARSVDGVYRLIDTNVVKSSDGMGFLINLDGDLLGITMTDNSAGTGDANILTALAISDLKGRLELLSNNRAVPYVGIVGRDITTDMASEDLPQGIYVSQTVIGSPAYMAGIQNGDIIMAMADMDNMSMKSFRNYLENAEQGQTVLVKVMRRGKDEYRELEFEVTLGANN